MKKSMKQKYEAVATYAKETYEPINVNQTVSFKQLAPTLLKYSLSVTT